MLPKAPSDPFANPFPYENGISGLFYLLNIRYHLAQLFLLLMVIETLILQSRVVVNVLKNNVLDKNLIFATSALNILVFLALVLFFTWRLRSMFFVAALSLLVFIGTFLLK